MTTKTGEIMLYTNKGCPFAHRTHIVLKELGLDHQCVQIDLDKPRDQWYLDINPAGLVPALYHIHRSLPGPVTLVESNNIVQYLIDAFPEFSGNLMPPATDPVSAYRRYTINDLIDTWSSKISPRWLEASLMSGTTEQETKADGLFEAIQTHLEPKLDKYIGAGKGPFVGVSERLTLFEVMTAPWVLRIHDFSNGFIHPVSLTTRLNSLSAYSKWSKAVISQESVTYTWEREYMIEVSLRVAPTMRKKFAVTGHD